MRTTVRLDDGLLRDLKRLAAQEGVTLTALLERAVREMMVRRRRPRARQPVQLPTFKGRGLQPGVDLDDTSALLDLMERADDPA